MLPDHGPIYLETDLTRFPVEPWAVYSQFLFLVVVAYWAWRIRGRRREQRFLALCLPLLAVQSVGSIVYHATRAHLAWMLLDVIPLYLVCLLAAGHFWRRFGLSALPTVAAVVVPVLLGAGAARLVPLPGYLGAALTYGGFFLAILIPALALLPDIEPRHRSLPFTALAALVLALFFRSADHAVPWLPMGTHWLWHVFGALAVNQLIRYVYVLDRKAS